MTSSQFVDLSSPLRLTNAGRLAVQDQIASLETRLDDLAHQKNLAFTHLDSLVSEKSLLETEMMRRKSSLHPIKLLPSNLLPRIFKFYVEIQPKGVGVLQCVSKEWNIIVKNLPTLWTTLHIGDYALWSWKRYIDACFLRSKNLPLEVRFLFDGTSQYGQDTQLNVVLDLLYYLTFLVSSRWVSLEFTWLEASGSWGRSPRFYKLRNIIQRASSLQSIHVRGGFHLTFMDPSTGSVYPKATYGSSLRSLHIYDIAWDELSPKVPVPSVEELTIEWNNSNAWYDLMSQRTPWLSCFPSLRRLSLHASNTPTSLDIPSGYHITSYAVSDLHTLKIVGPVPATALKNIRLPALETLRIYENIDGEHILEEDSTVGSMSHNMAPSQFVDLSSPLRPTNAERLAVQDQIASLEPRLEDIQCQRKVALAHLNSLLVEKSLLETEIKRRKELLHPINAE
ncbi:2344_t:CDS:2 [Acaulospora colombiana]|uniref:2344_t:CDS:1 n=1 Tax=Acaulospora colombiana TaxID=27376 RepID=A0ACA9N7W6_9GLOM|nr:2344_t:CDS:2 [Acaulospora colombiana]